MRRQRDELSALSDPSTAEAFAPHSAEVNHLCGASGWSETRHHVANDNVGAAAGNGGSPAREVVLKQSKQLVWRCEELHQLEEKVFGLHKELKALVR